MKNSPDLSKRRDDFPMMKALMRGKPLVYLDSAATAQKPQSVIDAMMDYYQNHYGTVHRAIYELSEFATQKYEGTREKVRAFLNSSSTEEIIFTRGTTEGINLVASSFGKAFVQPGDEVVISEMEHHSNIVPWQMLCEARGAILKVIPMNERAELMLDHYDKMLNKKTKIVAVGHIANSTGTINPVKELIAMAHHAGAKVLIDGAQSAPHMPVDVQELDADFFVFSGHKAYGPTGVGILYGKKALLDAMPPHHGGGDMIDKVTFPKTTYNALPLKFEAGTPMIAEVIGLGAAIDYLKSVGLSNIFQWENGLRDYAMERLKEIQELQVVGTAQHKAGIISFSVSGIHPLDIGTMLDLRGVALRTGQHCTQPTMRYFELPSGTSRISFGLYNNKHDIDVFISALKDVISILKIHLI